MIGSGEERIANEAYFTRDPQCVARLWDFFNLSTMRILEPCAGAGHMVTELRSYGAKVTAWELHDYPDRLPDIKIGRDFLRQRAIPEVDAIITNPPFDEPVPIIRHALELLPEGHVCMLMRHEWMCGKGTRDRRQELLASSRFMSYIPILGRPVWHEEVKNGPRHNYGWYIWGPGDYHFADLWL